MIYNPLNQYRVVMELAAEFLQGPETLKRLYVTNAAGAQVPLASFARVETTNTPLAVNHQSGSPASTISFNLPLGVSLSQATAAIEQRDGRARRAGVGARQLRRAPPTHSSSRCRRSRC